MATPEPTAPRPSQLAAWAAALPPGPWRWVPGVDAGWDGAGPGPAGMALVAADGTWVLWADRPARGVSLDGCGPLTADTGQLPTLADVLAALPYLLEALGGSAGQTSG